MGAPGRGDREESAAPSGSCPPAEDLAAFIDGNVGGTERDRLVAHLNACEDCYFIFAGTARFRADTVPRGARRPAVAPVLLRLAAAAVVLLGLGLAVLVMAPRDKGLDPPSSRLLVDDLLGAVDLQSLAAAIPTEQEQTLGFTGLSLTSRSFRLGAEVIDFGVSVRGSDGEKARDSLRQMGYTNVLSMDGGIRDWRQRGFPLTQG